MSVSARGRTHVVHIAGLRQLSCPRQQPWGPSSSIIEISRSASAYGFTLRIEMQSGDVIEVEANEISLPEAS